MTSSKHWTELDRMTVFMNSEGREGAIGTRRQDFVPSPPPGYEASLFFVEECPQPAVYSSI